MRRQIPTRGRSVGCFCVHSHVVLVYVCLTANLALWRAAAKIALDVMCYPTYGGVTMCVRALLPVRKKKKMCLAICVL